MKDYRLQETKEELARKIAQEAIVLLKNEDNCLPLKEGEQVALFGRTQFDTVIGGGGSGASFSAGTLYIVDELEKAGLILEPQVKQFYAEVRKNEEEQLAGKAASMEEIYKSLPGLVASGAIYELFGKYEAPAEEPVLSEELFEHTSTEKAIIVIGRISGGEECDRHVQNDYYLTDTEQKLIETVTRYYSEIIVVYNVNGACDTSWMLRYPQIKAALFMGSCGEQGAGALADILIGKVSPSARLSQTLAMSYEDYPSAKNFSYDKEGNILTYDSYGLSAVENGSKGFAISPVTVYEEGIYVGYRYFDSFGKEVMYPFGHGLSYAKFQMALQNVEKENGELHITVAVQNVSGEYAAKEVVQLYVTNPEGNLEQPLHQLKAFAKTRCLQSGETEEVLLSIAIRDLASFDESQNAYVLGKGSYVISIGESLTALSEVIRLEVPETIVTECVKADIGILECNRDKFHTLSKVSNDCNAQMTVRGISEFEKTVTSFEEKVITFTIKEEEIISLSNTEEGYDFTKEAKKSTMQDVSVGKVSVEEFVNQMSVKELAVLCNGYGPGLPFCGVGQDAPSTIQDDDGNDIAYGSHKSAAPGYMNPAIEKYGILSACYKDGPASVGQVAWPTGMMIGCTFNVELAQEFGRAIGQEALDADVQCWLAPGMNIIRNPIEGRAFEYFSEDPYLAGMVGASVSIGAMEHEGLSVCPKHFALNEQETYRRGSEKKNIDAVDSIADARTIREIYLKPFEIVVKMAKPKAIMTSFNKVNGTFAAGNKKLCTDILRREWGYDGIVITDWGDFDSVVDGADAVAAGNDIVMPGGPPVIKQVLKGYEEGRVTLEDLRTAVAHMARYLLYVQAFSCE